MGPWKGRKRILISLGGHAHCGNSAMARGWPAIPFLGYEGGRAADEDAKHKRQNCFGNL